MVGFEMLCISELNPLFQCFVNFDPVFYSEH